MLWKRLRSRQLNGLKFRRQAPLLGFYTDFFCESANLIIELDGGRHASQIERDEERTRILQAAGITVLRFWNNDVMANLEGVLEEIARIASAATPHPVLLPTGEGTMLQPSGPLANPRNLV